MLAQAVAGQPVDGRRLRRVLVHAVEHHLVARALALDDAYFAGARDALRRKRDRLCAGLRAAGLDVLAPEGGYFATADVRAIGEDDGRAFCRALPERAGVVAAAPGLLINPVGAASVAVEGVGGDGLVSVRDLGGEYYRFDEAARTLTGEHSGERYALGQRLDLRLAEANPVSGALRFELPEGKGAGVGSAPSDAARQPRVLKRRGRPANIRHQGRR